MGVQAIASAPTYADQVDGLRFILRQLSYREEQEIEFPASEQPELFYPESPTRKVFADCPNTIYRQFNVHPDHTYRLTGTRGDSAYIAFTAHRAAATERVLADLHDGESRLLPTARWSSSSADRRRARTGSTSAMMAPLSSSGSIATIVPAERMPHGAWSGLRRLRRSGRK